MVATIDKILKSFRPCFSREASFEWFVVIIFGFMVRVDQYGITSFVRCFLMESNHYACMVHFFKANSWDLDEICLYWLKAIFDNSSPKRLDDYIISVGDTIKLAKEATRMSLTKLLYQESNNSNKPEYIQGHNIGVIALLIGKKDKIFAIPVVARIHEGVSKFLMNLQNKEAPKIEGETVVNLHTLMVQMAARAIKKPQVLVLDAFYSYQLDLKWQLNMLMKKEND